ncbi:MAG TPA: LysM domain-containing protein [Dehalococcoidia bacterium]|nr:LysM domain-containing protein [Dehalococcoidia bacterium]
MRFRLFALIGLLFAFACTTSPVPEQAATTATPGGAVVAPAVTATPAAPTSVPPTATATPVTAAYTVQPGDTLSGIAARFGTSVAALQAANGLTDPNLIRVGQTLRIPGVGEVLPTPLPTATPSGPTATPAPTQPPAPTATPRPAATPTPPPVVSTGFAYGMQIEPSTDINRALAMVTDAGFGWAKAQIRWENLEGSKGAINWGYMDNIVNAARARGVKVLFSVVTAPRWARPGDTDFSVPGPPANPQDYADFVRAIAAHYPTGVDAIEVWNEQNLWYEWGGAGKMNAGDYVALLKAAHAAIKAANPNIIVVSGAPTPAGNVGNLAIDDVSYLGQMYAAGAKGYFDAVGVHPSGFNNPPDDDPGTNSTAFTNYKGHWSFYFRNFERYREVMVNNGDGDKKLWFTEFGWAAAQGAAPPASEYGYATQNTEAMQADYLRRAFEIATSRGYVEAMFVWNLNFAPSAEADDRYGKRAFSIIQTTWSPRPSYCSLAALLGRRPAGC